MKSQVREKAIRLGLSTAERPESQDLCFLGKKSPDQFLMGLNACDDREGDIMDPKGNIIGRHNGLSRYTIGQRKGIKIAATEPFYVIQKDVATNTLIIGFRSELGRKIFSVANINWILGREPNLPANVLLQIRYHAKKVEAMIHTDSDGRIEVSSSVVLRDITPGQIAVFYLKEEVVGSGIIQ